MVMFMGPQLPETNIFAPKNDGVQVRNLLFQGSIFMGKLLVSGRVTILIFRKMMH